MDSIDIEILGMFAGTCTTSCLIPQIYRIWKTRSVKDISVVMYVIFMIGVMSWLIYGIHVNSISMIISNSLSLCLAILIFAMKFKFDN